MPLNSTVPDQARTYTLEQKAEVDWDRRLMNQCPSMYRAGMRIHGGKPGYACVTMPIDGNHMRLGWMFAGMLFSLAEAAGGVIAECSFDPSQLACVAKDISIKYIQPAVTDIKVEVSLSEAQIDSITTEVIAHGKAQLLLKCKLYDTGGNLVAITTNEYLLTRISQIEHRQVVALQSPSRQEVALTGRTPKERCMLCPNACCVRHGM